MRKQCDKSLFYQGEYYIDTYGGGIWWYLNPGTLSPPEIFCTQRQRYRTFSKIYILWLRMQKKSLDKVLPGDSSIITVNKQDQALYQCLSNCWRQCVYNSSLHILILQARMDCYWNDHVCYDQLLKSLRSNMCFQEDSFIGDKVWYYYLRRKYEHNLYFISESLFTSTLTMNRSRIALSFSLPDNSLMSDIMRR